MKKQILLAMLSIFMINTQCMWQKALDYTKKQGGNIGLIGVGATIMATALYLEYQHKQTDKNNKLFDAIRENNLEKTRAALKDGADVSAYCNGYDDEFINCGKQPILHSAVYYHASLDIIKLLVEGYKADIFATNKDGSTVLRWCDRNKYAWIRDDKNRSFEDIKKVIDYFLDNGLSATTKNNDQNLPYEGITDREIRAYLHKAYNKEKAFEYVKDDKLYDLKNFKEVRKKDENIFSVPEIGSDGHLVIRPKYEYKTYIYHYIQDVINEQDKLGRTFLHWAVINNNLEMVQFLCTFNPDFTIRNNAGGTALEYATDKYIKLFLQQKIDQSKKS